MQKRQSQPKGKPMNRHPSMEVHMKPVTLLGILIGLGAANACTEPAPTATVPVFEGSAMAIAANGRNATASSTL